MLCAMFSFAWPTIAVADVTVFQCNFPQGSGGPDFPFIVTVYDDGSPARIGAEQGVGDKASPYFDAATGAYIFVEFNGVGLPCSLTTVLKDGAAWHSRHTLDVGGHMVAEQMLGTCSRRTIR